MLLLLLLFTFVEGNLKYFVIFKSVSGNRMKVSIFPRKVEVQQKRLTTNIKTFSKVQTIMNSIEHLKRNQ